MNVKQWGCGRFPKVAINDNQQHNKNEDKELVLFAIAFSCLGVCNRAVSLVMNIVVGMYKQELYKVAPFDGSFQSIV
ncbi:hypothetical protein [Hoylesella shahii]|uniref:hypothetical protein n=1 Tax=Hoylesella shahii TaxID=228603 RepID=UPI0028E367B8|nr:hypothetical protein [Hoylesella shahii]